ncbi:MAG: hypothetical protein CMN76_06275 [Spirochaetaceae bacterium]|nr:hypothetical protein [Spirochaetaceae bacterium]|tara:strand:- start:295767 stop:296885 length:1119 start_codon:yes stop_codon:yes gene_type:complete
MCASANRWWQNPGPKLPIFPVSRTSNQTGHPASARSATGFWHWQTRYAQIPALVFALIFMVPLGAQSPESFPDLLLPENGSPLPGNPTPEGTFLRNAQDFLVCAGKDFQGPGPEGSSPIEWQGNTFNSVARFNNETIQEFIRDPSNDENQSLALERFEAGLKADPQFYPFLYNSARLNLLQRDFEEAIRLFERASGLIPDDPGPYLNIGKACEELQEHRCVVHYYKKAHEKAPLRPDAIYALGIYYLETDRRPQAEIYLKQGLRDFPADSRMKIGMARLHLQSGDRLRARVLLESIPTESLTGERRQDYDLSLHYYLAKIYRDSRDYRRALEQLNILLANPSAPFFLENSRKDLEKQREVLQRLAKAQAISD